MKFPVGRTTLDVLEFLWRERRAMLRFGLLPVAALSILGVVLHIAMDRFALGPAQWQHITANFVTALAQALVLLPVTVLWYRLSVIGETEIAGRPLFSFGTREWRLLGWQVLVVLIVLAVAVVCGAATLLLTELNEEQESFALLAVSIAWTIGWLLGLLLLMARLSMVLVLAALDQPVSLGAAWRMTGGLGWRLLTATLLIVVAALMVWALVALAGFIVATIAAIATAGPLGLILKVLEIVGQNIANLIALLGIATLFGFVYKRLLAGVADQPAPSLA